LLLPIVTVSGVDLVSAALPGPDVAVTRIVDERGFLLSALGFELGLGLEFEVDMEPQPTPQRATASRQKMANVVFQRRRMPRGSSNAASAMLAAVASQWLTPELLACFSLIATVRVTTEGVTPSSATLLLLNVQLKFAGSDPQES
jgi:hypothetical protein